MEQLGWKPEKDFKVAMQETIKWYIENENWWRTIKDKQEEYKRFYEAQYKNR
jgi:dTDP-glucose 4,6-dehydratase